jgi:hypothetical protein
MPVNDGAGGLRVVKMWEAADKSMKQRGERLSMNDFRAQVSLLRITIQSLVNSNIYFQARQNLTQTLIKRHNAEIMLQ